MKRNFPRLMAILSALLLMAFLMPGSAQAVKKGKSAKAKKEQKNISGAPDQAKIDASVKNRRRAATRVSFDKPFSSKAKYFGVSAPARSFQPRSLGANAYDKKPGTPKPSVRETYNPELPRGVEGPLVPIVSEDKAVIRKGPVQPLIPSPNLTFEGSNNIDNANIFGFRLAPPDPNGDVGPNHYVQTINLVVEIFDKSGNTVSGPFPMSDLFASLPESVCSTLDDGDPIVLYDQLADRWLISQFAISVGLATLTTPTSECIAISQTPDPTGTYYVYDFVMPNLKLNDYPHFGVWPNAYYMTDNQFNLAGTAFLGAGVFALDREKMLAGDPNASFIYFDLAADPQLGGQLPADADGLVPPAADAPGVIFQFAADEFGDPIDGMRIFEFSPDFDTPANSTFIERADSFLPVPSFDPRTPAGRSDIPQPGTITGLDGIGDRLMHRVQYRNFGDYETFVMNHTVDVDTTGIYQAGVRFYELRKQNGAFAVNKAFTLAPDADSRWMASVALDASGNMGIGYSVSSSATAPAIRYAGMAHDNTYLGEAELQAGTGSQTSSNRWGDYTAIAVDPLDECTFWYTNQYFSAPQPEPCPVTASGACWKTRVGNFNFPAGYCTSPATGTLSGLVTDAISANPITGAQVHIVNTTTGAEFATATDSTGNYSRVLPPGDYEVHASANLYEPSSTVNVTITASATTVQNFTLVPLPFLELDSVTIDDSAGNDNGVIDVNECVNLTVTLVNSGPGDATGISGTLVSNSSGVTIPAASATQAFPNIASGGTGSNATPFQVSISPAFVCGANINLTLNVTSDDGPFTVPITLTTGTQTSTSFPVAGPFPIPDGQIGGGNGVPLDIPIVVSGVTSFDKIRVGLHITHTWDGDLHIFLVGPDGTTTVALSEENGSSADNYGTDCPADGNDTIFDDDALTSITTGAAPFVGEFSPQEPLSGLNSQNPNGTWTLRVIDDYGFDTGQVECLFLEFVDTTCVDGGGVCAGSVPVLEDAQPTVSGGNGDDNIDTNECFDLAVAVTNNGTATATGVNATLSSTTPGVTILTGTAAYPDIGAGASGTNLTPFSVQTSENFDCTAGNVDFVLDVTTNEGNFSLPFSLTPGFSLGAPLTFSSTDTPIPIPDNTSAGTSSTINVSGVVGKVGKVTVSLHATQTFNGDLIFRLKGPNGDSVLLSANNGGNSDNYGTGCGDPVVFDDDSLTPITSANPGNGNPIVGTFSPEELLAAFNLTEANGNWTLEVADVGPADLGQLECWSINITPAECEDGGCFTALFDDQFNDDVLATDWTYTQPSTWTEGSGFLTSNSPNKKATAIASPVFAGCQNCTISTAFQTTGGFGNRNWIYGWYISKQNNLEVLIKEQNDKIIVKQRIGNTIVKKANASVTIDPNTLYDIDVAYDGTQVTVSVDGTSVLTFVPVGTLPVGTVGFGVKKTSSSFDFITVQ